MRASIHGDVTLTNGSITVVVTSEDSQHEPDAIINYLQAGYVITRDERVQDNEQQWSPPDE